MTVTGALHQHVLKAPASTWTPAVEANDEIRASAWVAELKLRLRLRLEIEQITPELLTRTPGLTWNGKARHQGPCRLQLRLFATAGQLHTTG